MITGMLWTSGGIIDRINFTEYSHQQYCCPLFSQPLLCFSSPQKAKLLNGHRLEPEAPQLNSHEKCSVPTKGAGLGLGRAFGAGELFVRKSVPVWGSAEHGTMEERLQRCWVINLLTPNSCGPTQLGPFPPSPPTLATWKGLAAVSDAPPLVTLLWDLGCFCPVWDREGSFSLTGVFLVLTRLWAGTVNYLCGGLRTGCLRKAFTSVAIWTPVQF